MPGTELAERPLSTSHVALAVPRRKHRLPRLLVRGCLLGFSCAIAIEFGRVYFGDNIHAVIPNRVYRSAQLSGEGFEAQIRSHKIRTLINLRGCCDPAPWYLDECRAAHAMQIAHEDVCMSAGRLPSVFEMRRLLEILDRTEYPILIHCKRGSDRTGLIAASILLLQTGSSLEEARRQLGVRYGHLSLGRPAYLDEYFDLYREWLAQQGAAHSPALYRRFIEHDYCPAECRCEFEPLDLPAVLPLDQAVAFQLRVHNTGVRPWRFRPGTNAGIHAMFGIWDRKGNVVVNERAGLINALVPPGQSIDLTVAIPPLRPAGRYRLFLDMQDEQHCSFYQTGSEPLERELEVR
jgi:hypothetical protein